MLTVLLPLFELFVSPIPSYSCLCLSALLNKDILQLVKNVKNIPTRFFTELWYLLPGHTFVMFCRITDTKTYKISPTDLTINQDRYRLIYTHTIIPSNVPTSFSRNCKDFELQILFRVSSPLVELQHSYPTSHQSRCRDFSPPNGNASSYDLCSDRRLIMLNSEMLQQTQSSKQTSHCIEPPYNITTYQVNRIFVYARKSMTHSLQLQLPHPSYILNLEPIGILQDIDSFISSH